MEEIRVNEYIRTKKYICKVTKIMEQDEELPLYYCTDLGFGFLEKDILNHSFELMDLIEKGDYVNGEYVTDTWNGNRIETHRSNFHEDNIKSIVTKEQFESMQYIVEKV